MNHRPFEEWLLDDQPLTLEQERDLESHLRICTSCSAIAESNLALHSIRIISPAPGFKDRFQLRLAQRRREQRWRQIIGTLVLVLGGIGLLYWLAGPTIQEALNSPAAWITTVVGYFLFLLTSLQVLGVVSTILLRVVPTFVPPAGLLILGLVVSGVSLLWIFSIWRVTRTPQGV
jgi:hypothetical protein